MALADLVVVMNNGRIEQAANPREVFDAPRTEFVARFMGGHNVIELDGRKFGVRADRTELRLPLDKPGGRPVTVRDVEYQGNSVVVSLATENGSELTAMVPERSFYDRPFAVGDRAAVHWDPADLRDLQ